MRNQIVVTITTCCVVSEHRDYQLHLQTFFFHLDENRSLLNCSHWPLFVSVIRKALFCGREEFVTLMTCCMVSEHRYFQLHLQIIFFYLDENRSLLNCSNLPFFVSAIRQALFSSKDEFAAAVKKETETLRQQVRQKIAALPLDRKEGKHFKRVCRQSLIFAFFFYVNKKMEEEATIREMESKELTERNEQLRRETGELRLVLTLRRIVS